jgi:hypothetical protein
MEKVEFFQKYEKDEERKKNLFFQVLNLLNDSEYPFH